MSTVSPSIDPSASGDNALVEVSNAVGVHASLPELLGSLRGYLRSLVQFEFLAVCLHDAETDSMSFRVLEPEGAAGDPAIGVPVPLEGSYPGLVVRTGRPVSVRRVVAGGPMPSDRLLELGISSFCSVPLTTPRRTGGTLDFGVFAEGAYTEEDVEFMTQIARLVAVAIENAINVEAARAHLAALQREHDRLDLLLDVTNAVVTHLDTRALFRAIAPTIGAAAARTSRR